MAKSDKQKSPITRSGTRRLGDDYQDQVALEMLIDWLEHGDRYRWVELEADEVGALDDVTAEIHDGGLVLKQVKFSTNPNPANDHLTWELLLAREEGKSGKAKTSLLQKWASSLESVGGGQRVEASLESNRQPSVEFRATLKVNGTVEYDAIPSPVRDQIVQQLGSEELARSFFGEFRFNLNRPNLTELEEGIRRRFYAHGGTAPGWLNLKQELRRWVCFREDPQPDGKITLSDVKRAALWYRLQSLPQEFEIPSDYVLPSTHFHEEMLSRLSASRSGCALLFGSPGVGKSTFASKLFADLSERGVPAVRHHYFLSLTDTSISFRLDHQRAAESLMHDLQRDHSKALGELSDDNPNPKAGDLRKWLEVCGRAYAAENKSLVVIVDGLDHVWREQRSIDELDRLLRLLLPAPGGVFILFVSQPVNDNLLPPQLLRAVPRDTWIALPLLDEAATAQWLSHHLNDLDPGGSPLTEDDPRVERLVTALHRRSRGHPLHLRYTIRAIQERGLSFDEDTIVSLPACPHEGITEYYADLWRGLPDQSRDILHLFAATQFPWPRAGVCDCLDPDGRDAGSILRALKQVEHLLTADDLGLHPFHGSLLVFVRDLSEHAAYAGHMKRRALAWLQSAAPEHWRWAYTWLLAADLGDDQPLLTGPNRQWTVAAIARCRPKAEVASILSRAVRTALQRRDLPRAIHLSMHLGYYLETHGGYHEAPGSILFARLRLEEGGDVRAVLRSRLEDLSNNGIQILAEADARVGDRTHIRRYFRELQNRIWGSGQRRRHVFSTGGVNEIDPLLAVAAQPGGPEISWVGVFAAKNREKGNSPHILRVLSEHLRIRKDAATLRMLLPVRSDVHTDPPSEDALIGEERLEVIRALLLLSLEEGVNCDPYIREWCGEPLALIVAFAKNTPNFTPKDASFPDVSIFGLEAHTLSGEGGQGAADTFAHTFLSLLANHLWDKAERNTEWLLTMDGDTWPHQFVAHLDQMTAALAGQLRSGRPPRLSEVYGGFGRFPPPECRGNENLSEYRCGLAAGKALIALGFDLHLLLRSFGGESAIARDDLQAILSSGYCNRELWIDAYLARRRPVLSSTGVDWLIATVEADLASSVEHFSERAGRYAALAGVAILHDRTEKAEELMTLAASNLLAHGYHKDMLLSNVLNSVLAFHRGGKGLDHPQDNPREWLLRLAPAIARVYDYTDGDHTRYFPRELAAALREVAPGLLPAYYRWLAETEEYADALEAFKEFVGGADLSDPIIQAIVRTGVDDGSVNALVDRASNGEKGAQDALALLEGFLGSGIRSCMESGTSPPASPDNAPSSPPPSPSEFPPPTFLQFIDALRASSTYTFENAIRGWIKYWASQDQREEVFTTLKAATERGQNIWCVDELYALAVEVQGRAKAFPWLEHADRQSFGWSEYSPEEQSRCRWEVIKTHYPSRWYDFLRNTIVGDDTRYGPYIGHGSFSRLVRYLVLLSQHELARKTVQQMVDCALELVSPINLTTPAWVNAEGDVP